jgi:hypothetical protein
MLCEEKIITAAARSTLSIPHNIKQATPSKTHNNIGKIDKYYTNCGTNNHNVETCRKKKE